MNYQVFKIVKISMNLTVLKLLIYSRRRSWGQIFYSKLLGFHYILTTVGSYAETITDTQHMTLIIVRNANLICRRYFNGRNFIFFMQSTLGLSTKFLNYAELPVQEEE